MYDSVCPDIFIYKLIIINIYGKTGQWIENFTHGRLFQALWKSIWSRFGHCLYHIPIPLPAIVEYLNLGRGNSVSERLLSLLRTT